MHREAQTAAFELDIVVPSERVRKGMQAGRGVLRLSCSFSLISIRSMLISLVLIFLRLLVPAKSDSRQLDHALADSLGSQRRRRGARMLAGHPHPQDLVSDTELQRRNEDDSLAVDTGGDRLVRTDFEGGEDHARHGRCNARPASSCHESRR